MGATLGPLHLLLLYKPFADYLIHRGLDKRGCDGFSIAIPIPIVRDGARSQGSNPGQTQVMALDVSHFSRIFLWIWFPLSDIKRPSI
jgi:hypothetical protein